MMITSEHLQWEALMGCIDPLLEEGHKVTIARQPVRDILDSEEYQTWTYRVVVTKEGQPVAEGTGYPLTEAMAAAYMATPERESEADSSIDVT